MFTIKSVFDQCSGQPKNLGSKASQEPLGTQGNNKAESYVVLKQLYIS